MRGPQIFSRFQISGKLESQRLNPGLKGRLEAQEELMFQSESGSRKKSNAQLKELWQGEFFLIPERVSLLRYAGPQLIR